MTTSDIADSPQTTLRSALRDVLDATLEFANSKVSQKADDWTEDLKDVGQTVDDLAASGGAAEQAGYQGLKAELQGRNPVWAAAKGAWAGASGKVRLAAVLIVVLVLLSRRWRWSFSCSAC